MARPTKLTPDVQQTLALALGEGATVEHACAFAGIAPRTFYHWMERGENGEEAFVQFVQITTRARGRGIVTDLSTISKAVQAGDWRAAAWRLQHRYPQDYGAKLKISGDADNPLRVLHTMPHEQLDARILQLWRQCGYDGGPAAVPAATSETTPEDLLKA
jgi:hypothetical protein